MGRKKDPSARGRIEAVRQQIGGREQRLGNRSRARRTFVELGVAAPSVAMVAVGPVIQVTGPQEQRLTVRLQAANSMWPRLIRK
jgi:hypothetical protein